MTAYLIAIVFLLSAWLSMASATLNSYPSERKKRSIYCVFCGPDTRQQLLPLLSFEPDGVGSAVAIRLALRLTRNEKACQSICAAIAGQSHEGGGIIAFCY